MSDAAPPLRIRAQPSPRDADTLRFLLDAPVEDGRGAVRFQAPGGDAPLACALFAIKGVRRVDVDGACIHVRKDAGVPWKVMKAPIAAAIRATLASAGRPLGEPPDETSGDQDARLLAAVRELLERRINPSIASHGGQISAERVAGGAVYLCMSGGCQGCAASQLTLRGGVERVLRAALPELRDIVDVTDHGAGASPFYARISGASGPRVSPIAGTASGTAQDGCANDTPPDEVLPLAARIRKYLEALAPSTATLSYGALAWAMGLSSPGAIARVTQALEDTMCEDARAGRPFIAARAVSRAGGGLPGSGFFDFARALSRGPRDGETEHAFHAREIARLDRTASTPDPTVRHQAENRRGAPV